MPSYDSDAGLLAHLQKQAGNIDKYAADINASVAVIQSIKDDAENMAVILQVSLLAEDFKTTVFSIKRTYLRGLINTPISAFPDAPTVPVMTLVAGVEKRSRERDQRFLRDEGITDTIKSALDLTDDTLRPDPETVKPRIKVTSAENDYKFTVEVSDKGEAEMFSTDIRRSTLEKWIEVKSGTGKSLTVAVEPTTAGESEQILVRVRLLLKNQNYGAASDPQFVTVNP